MKTQSTLQRTLKALLITGIAVFALASAHADAPKVTANNYVRAETRCSNEGVRQELDKCFGKFAVISGNHYDVDNQVTVRGNRDTLYYMFGTRLTLTSPLTIHDARYQKIGIMSLQDRSIRITPSGPSIYGLQKGTLYRWRKVGSALSLNLALRTFMRILMTLSKIWKVAHRPAGCGRSRAGQHRQARTSRIGIKKGVVHLARCDQMC